MRYRVWDCDLMRSLRRQGLTQVHLSYRVGPALAYGSPFILLTRTYNKGRSRWYISCSFVLNMKRATTTAVELQKIVRTWSLVQ